MAVMNDPFSLKTGELPCCGVPATDVEAEEEEGFGVTERVKTEAMEVKGLAREEGPEGVCGAGGERWEGC
jgi:hypothetical protein